MHFILFLCPNFLLVSPKKFEQKCIDYKNYDCLKKKRWSTVAPSPTQIGCSPHGIYIWAKTIDFRLSAGKNILAKRPQPPARDIIFPTAVPDPQYILPIRL